MGSFYTRGGEEALGVYRTDPDLSGRPHGEIPELHQHFHVGRWEGREIVTTDHYWLIVPGTTIPDWAYYDPILCRETPQSVQYQPFWPKEDRPPEHSRIEWQRVKKDTIGEVTELLQKSYLRFPGREGSG